MIRKLDHIARLVSKDMWRFGRPRHAPSEYFRKNIWVTPFYEDDVPAVVDLIGAAHVLNGSDYPHPEGLAEPAEFVDELEGLSAEAVRAIMRENLAGLAA
jgi:predicted TIM-barrel fold metal-dependent hydrolase